MGFERLLDDARAAGVALGIATTTTFDNIQALLQTTLGPGALQRFAVIGAGDQVPRKKPAPDIYKYVLHQLGLMAPGCRGNRGFGERRGLGERGRPVYDRDPELLDGSRGFCGGGFGVAGFGLRRTTAAGARLLS